MRSGIALFYHTENLDNKWTSLSDVQITIISFDFAYEGGMASTPISNLNTTVFRHLFGDHPFSQGIVLMPSLLRPKSRGSGEMLA